MEDREGGARILRSPERLPRDEAAVALVKELSRAKEELARELEANLKQLRTVLKETERIARDLELVLKEARTPVSQQGSQEAAGRYAGLDGHMGGLGPRRGAQAEGERRGAQPDGELRGSQAEGDRPGAQAEDHRRIRLRTPLPAGSVARPRDRRPDQETH